MISIATSEENIQLALPAQVICDWHADWTDLTERADYSRFPMWHTKNGKDSGSSGASGGGGGGTSGASGGGGATSTSHGSHKIKKVGDKKEFKKGKNRRNSSFESPDGGGGLLQLPNDKNNPKASKVMSHRGRRSSSKMSSVIESVAGGGGGTGGTGGRRNSTYRVQSILGSNNRQMSTSFKNLSPAMSASFRAGSQLAVGGGGAIANKTDLTGSRVITSQSSNGFSFNYQLSSKLFRDKGWTVLKIDREETNHFNEKSIVNHLKSSLLSMLV